MYISRLIRRFRVKAQAFKTIQLFRKYGKIVSQLQASEIKQNSLLLIRLDDIGDFLLFQNFITHYCNSPKFLDYRKTFLANQSWKPFFELLDPALFDEIIWIDKQEYFKNNEYRLQLWQTLRSKGFEWVICPSRSRNLLLDDVCTMATGAIHTLGNNNSQSQSLLTILSNKQYSDLFMEQHPSAHEFIFNRLFANWCTGSDFNIALPHLSFNMHQKRNKTIVCFIGAAARSRQWPANKWIALINKLNKHFDYQVLIAGSIADVPMANYIALHTRALSITGNKSLIESKSVVEQSELVIANDSMAAHLAVSCSTPVIIISNGNNYFRFADYTALPLAKVKTIYAGSFLRWKVKNGLPGTVYNNVPGSQMATVSYQTVFQAAQNILRSPLIINDPVNAMHQLLICFIPSFFYLTSSV